jgi:hypothetical protein
MGNSINTKNCKQWGKYLLLKIDNAMTENNGIGLKYDLN